MTEKELQTENEFLKFDIETLKGELAKQQSEHEAHLARIREKHAAHSRRKVETIQDLSRRLHIAYKRIGELEVNRAIEIDDLIND